MGPPHTEEGKEAEKRGHKGWDREGKEEVKGNKGIEWGCMSKEAKGKKRGDIKE